MVRQSRILGTGSYVPDRVVENEELCRPLRLTSSGVIRRTGIRARRWVTEGQTTSSLAAKAAVQALECAGATPGSIDAVLVSTTSPDMTFPSTACLVAAELGISGAAAFDVSASCSGFLYGLSMADACIRSGQFHRCLVIAAEVKSRFLNPLDEATAVLFGDGAGAVVLQAEAQSGPHGTGLLGVRLYADGARHDLIAVPTGGSRHPHTPEAIRAGLHTIQIRGGPLFRVAVKRLAAAVSGLLKEFGVDIGDVRHAVFHQANGRLLSALGRRLGLAKEAMTSVLEQYGNTSSASLPLALDHAARSGKLLPGDLVLLGAFGGGLTWGTALVRW